VIVPTGNQSHVPLDCPVCKIIMRDADDSRLFREFQCCSWCASRWAESHRDEWTEGWRPSQEDVDLEIARRQSSPIRLPIE
jgi:hypothetical protein